MVDNTQTKPSTMSFGMKIWLTQNQFQTQKYSNLDYKVLYTFNNELLPKKCSSAEENRDLKNYQSSYFIPQTSSFTSCP